MKKAEKIKILDDLIDRTAILVYAGSRTQASVKDDTLSFLRQTFKKSDAVEWEKRISKIAWSPSMWHSRTPKEVFVKYWNAGKKEFKDVLVSIKNEIELYTPNDEEYISSGNEKENNIPIIFLSHCSDDKLYGNALQKIITGLGVKNEQLIYTSHPLHKIPLDANIYDYLRKSITTKILMIFLWSDAYLESPACMNEMGAAWVTQSDYTNIYTPNFSFGNPKYHECAVDPRKMGAVLNGDNHCKTAMIELKNKILTMFGLSVEEKQATYLLDEFIKEILEISNQ